MLLTEAWEQYQLDKKIEGYSPLTLKTYYFQYNLLLRYFGDINMSEFTTEKLKGYLIEAGEHLKPSSLGHRVRCIKSLFRWIHDEGCIRRAFTPEYSEFLRNNIVRYHSFTWKFSVDTKILLELVAKEITGANAILIVDRIRETLREK
ncbi:phage integrase N-terminal SAM-like domain-containing protein [Bacillus cereus group sp. BfR-BA-01383]|uniref:phage integrase N-terminal SAM-like domain-containing protein n=1 Tax=Bacillus cereus group sp. BfR-BA-01383 TaxID=2920327 RepID=UPI001F57962A|nr:phage integrase N-terminal SAM-like domain-containing protein [Bacillus cereus group sp. BfR-BA-01383]